jgi:transposase
VTANEEERQQSLARKRAEIILKVRSGQMTAKEAAKVLGISRKTYYEWEQRGLQGMLEALSNRPPGRPEIPRDPEKEALKQKVEDLEQKLLLSEHVEEIRKLMDGLKDLEQEDRKKKDRRI